MAAMISATVSPNVVITSIGAVRQAAGLCRFRGGAKPGLPVSSAMAVVLECLDVQERLDEAQIQLARAERLQQRITAACTDIDGTPFTIKDRLADIVANPLKFVPNDTRYFDSDALAAFRDALPAIAVSVKPGDLRSCRKTNFKSSKSERIDASSWSS